jgi:hypothetical protein
MQPFKPYIARPIRYAGLAEPHGYRIKRYVILYGGGPFREDDFERGIEMAFESLPRPAVTDNRPGVGFLIMHQGNGADYIVLGWWDNENELPLRVVVRSQTADGQWRPAREGESVCVWDLEVIWSERQAYVQTVLGGGTIEAYLDRHIG